MARAALACACALVAACEVVAPIPDLTSGSGGAGSDAGTSDAATSFDAASVDAPPRDDAAAECAGHHLYCNPFESPSDLTHFVSDNAKASIDGTVARLGAASLRLDLADTSRNGVFAYGGAVALPPHVFVRVLFHFSGGVGNYLFLGRPDYSDGVQLYVGGDGHWHFAQYSGSDLGSPLSADTTNWHCSEIEVDSAAMSANAWFDGAGPLSINLANPSLPYAFVTLVVSKPDMKTAYFDELVIDDKRIGCP